MIPGRAIKAFSRHTLRKRFRTACRVLGHARLETLTIHHGRHTFISHALAGGRTLAEVRDAAGHCSVSITSAYLHVAGTTKPRWETSLSVRGRDRATVGPPAADPWLVLTRRMTARL